MKTKTTHFCRNADYSPRRDERGKTLAGWLLVLALALTMAAGQAQTFTILKSFGNLTNVTGFNPQSTLVQGPDGTLYGTTLTGDGSVAGTVFKMQPDGSGFTVLKWFTNSIEGANPSAGLALSGSMLYGTTFQGGSSSYGTVFKVNTDGTGYTVLKNFTGSDGANPAWASLTLAGSALYGATYSGGSSNLGTLFKVNTDGTGYTVLKNFTGSDGASPDFGLTLSGNMLYGTAQYGGSSNYGTVFKLSTDGTGFTVLKNYTNFPDGAYPNAVLTLSGSVLYGTTYGGGSSNFGTVFKVNTDGTGYTVLKDLAGGSDGGNPSGALPLSGSVLYGTTTASISSGNGTVFRVNTDGTGYTVLRNLNLNPHSDGWGPYAGLMLSGSVLYGMASHGGSSGGGTVFKVNTDGTGYTVLENFGLRTFDWAGPWAGLTLSGRVLYGTTLQSDDSGTNGTVFEVNTDGTDYTVLKSFGNSHDGALPYSDLTLSGSVLYGTSSSGGSAGRGTVFQLNTDGTDYTVLKAFTGSDGANPYAGLTLSDGVLYGSTASGGSSNYGIVFKLNTDGSGYAVLKNFTGSPDGNSPAGLILSASVLYGMTYSGGSSNYGTVFKLNTDGTGFSVLKSFAGSDGANPYWGLTLSDSVLYGTTDQGGSSGYGTVFKVNTDGTGYTVLRSFAYSDGAHPDCDLRLSGSVLYGTTSSGGSSGRGTVFQVNTDGTGYSVLRHLTGVNGDGATPFAGLTLSGSTLYGTTASGGSFGDGTVFKLDLSPPLTIQPLGNAVVLSWTNPAFSLQSAPEVTGAYTNIPSATSPYTNAITGGRQFFRLIGN